jgi:RNA polymerase sigma-70 factor (ECF subfamily)
MCVETLGEAIDESATDEPTGFENVFHRYYEPVARAVARVVRDTSRAEEIAAEAFWKFWRNPKVSAGGCTAALAEGSVVRDKNAAWLYKTAIRMALDELKKEARRLRRESEQPNRVPAQTPEEAHVVSEERSRVRLILAALDPRQAELLLLRNSDLSYAEVAAALDLNPASVGTLISRAQQAFRKEYVNQYGEPEYE